MFAAVAGQPFAAIDGGHVVQALAFDGDVVTLEFRQPAWLKQWPFPHTIDLTYRLHDGALEMRTAIRNESGEPMPVAIGYHRYFQLTDA
jgi:galactose mutarotase-like enzyme